MATTSTPNLGLIKPTLGSGELMENWPRPVGLDTGQNAVNCNAIDAVFKNTSATWSPTWTADSVNPVLGSGGSVTGSYIRVWPKLVIGYIRIFTGTTGFSAGTGAYRFSNLPFAVSSSIAQETEVPLGKVVLVDASTVANNQTAVIAYNIAANNLVVRTESGTASWSSVNPFTLDQSDRMGCYFSYLTDAA